MRVIVNARFTAQRMTGVPRSAYEIVRRLLRSDGDEYRLIAPRSSERRVLPVEEYGRIRQGHLWEQIEIPLMMRDTEAVLYCPASSGPIAVRRQVTTVHDLFPVEHPEWFSKAFATWYRLLLPPLLRRSAFVIVNSQYTRERTIELFGLPDEKVILAYFAHDSERFRIRSEDALGDFGESRSLPKRYLLYIGSIEPRKNLRTLAAAWSRTRARKEGMSLVIAGAAGRSDVFKASESGAEMLDSESVRLLGFVDDDDLPLLYQGADALALPSLAEGFGLPILEAMACGTPVVCADNTAMPEIAGGCAKLVDALDVEAWTEAIDEVMSNDILRAAMREAGLKRASAFSWDRTTEVVRATLEAAEA